MVDSRSGYLLTAVQCTVTQIVAPRNVAFHISWLGDLMLQTSVRVLFGSRLSMWKRLIREGAFGWVCRLIVSRVPFEVLLLLLLLLPLPLVVLFLLGFV